MTGNEVIDWKGLQALGWPYSRTHTWRMMKAGKFVRCFKLGNTRNSHPVWWRREVLAWLAERQQAAASS